MRFLPAALLALLVVAAPLTRIEPAAAQPRKATNLAARCANPSFAKANPRSCARYGDKKPSAEPAKPEQPSRPDFTADEQAAAVIPGIPDARFWADSEKDFLAALPSTLSRGPALHSRSMARALDRRRRRRVRRRPAQRLGGIGQAPGVFRGHRGEPPLPAGALYIRRRVAGSGAQAGLHRQQRGRHLRRRQDAREPGRYL